MNNKPIYMLLKDVKKSSDKFDATHKVALYPINKDEPPKGFSDFATEVLTRLDNLENLVNTQFKKHGGIK